MIVGMVDDRALRFRQRVMPPVPTPSPVDFLASNYLRAAPQIAKTAAASNIFNPVPSVTEAVNEGRLPTGAEAGLDAGFLAAGFLPVGKAASQLNAIVKRLNKSTDVRDFMTERGLQNRRPNDAFEGLYRPGAQSFDFDDVPQPASEYLFDLVPTEKLAPLREFDRASELAGQGRTGPDNLKKLAEHMAEGGKWNDPTAVAYYPDNNWAYLAEGNHRLALAEELGLERLPTTLWRAKGIPPEKELLRTEPFIDEAGLRGTQKIYSFKGQKVGPLDTDQLARNQYPDFPKSVGNFYVPPDMHPYLLKYFQPK